MKLLFCSGSGLLCYIMNRRVKDNVRQRSVWDFNERYDVMCIQTADVLFSEVLLFELDHVCNLDFIMLEMRTC